VKSMRYLVPALEDLGVLLKGAVSPPSSCSSGTASQCISWAYEGLSMIASSGIDHGAWDALAKAADQPLCVLLGGSIGP